MKPAAKIIVRAPARIPWRLLLLAAAGGIALAVWSWFGTEQKTGAPSAAALIPVVQSSNTQAEPKAVIPRKTEISTDVLKGEGITVAEWLQKIAATAPELARFSPEDLITRLPELRICDYEGDAALPVGEALDLLRYAGLTITPIANSNGFDVRWADSHTRIADDLSASTSPDSLAWGALRCWQRLTLKLDPQWKILPENTKTQAQLRTLAFAVQGEVCQIEIGVDGHVTFTRSKLPTFPEFCTALVALTDGAGKQPLAFDAIDGLSTLAISNSPSVLSPSSQDAINVLIKNLNSSDIETQRMSAWALGHTPAVPAIEALVNTIENSNCPLPLASAAFAALAHSEKIGRTVDAAKMGAENYARRQVAYERERVWLAQPHLAYESNPPDIEFAAAMCAAAEAFRVEMALPHLKSFQAQRDRNQPVPASVSINSAGPNWLHRSFDAEDALKLLRSGDRRNVLAALWRWNRRGADSPTALATDETEVALADAIKSILKTSPSATQRRLALEALFRRCDARLGVEPKALCDDTGLALNAFLNDPSPGVQRAASAIVGKLAGIVQLQTLAQSELAVRPPAGTDQLLSALVKRFWMDHEEVEETSVVLTHLIDQLLAAEDTLVAERAAWAKMQTPTLDVGEKLCAAKGMLRTPLRAAALKGINVSRTPVEVPLKLVEVFLYDTDAPVRAAIFSAHLPQLIKRGVERTKLYARGLQDEDAAVRLAVLNARLSISPDSREALSEKIKALAESDASPDVRTTAAAWMSPGTSVRSKD